MLNELSLRNLRCVEESGCSLHPSLTVLTGRNAQGKTAVLEGLYFLALGRSFRTRRLSQLVRQGAPMAAVEGVTADGVRLRAVVAGETRHLFLNGVECRWEDYLGSLRAVVYSSELLPVVKGDLEAGRRFMDRGVALLDPSYVRTLSAALRAVRQRNQLLKKSMQEGWSLQRLQREIRPWDELLVRGNGEVSTRRAAFCDQLNVELARLPTELSYDALEVRHRPSLTGSEAAQQLAARVESWAGAATRPGPAPRRPHMLAEGRPRLPRFFWAATLQHAGSENRQTGNGAQRRCGALFLMDDVDSDLHLERTVRAVRYSRAAPRWWSPRPGKKPPWNWRTMAT